MLYSSPAFLPGTHAGLVLLCHGQVGTTPKNTLYQTVFDDLARCLAVHGFVVASIRHASIGSNIAAESFFQHTKYLLNSPSIKQKFNLEGKPVAFVGHSESGPGAIAAAKRITQLEISNVIAWIHAVVGLAPTDVPDDEVASDFAGSLLILQGTHDGDTPAGGGSIVPYERSKNVSGKHFCWIRGLNHKGYLSGPMTADTITFDAASRLSEYSMRMISWNYVTAFLLWKMSSKSSFRPLFIGDGSFMLEADPTKALQDDLKAGRVGILPRYDTSFPSPFDLPGGAPIVFQQMLQNGVAISVQNPAKFAELRTLASTAIPQRTKGFVVQWNRNDPKLKAPRVFVPCAKTVMNASPKFLEFQAILIGKDSPKTGLVLPLRLQRLELGLVVETSPVFVTIPAPLVIQMSSPISGEFTRSILGTIRLPITSWGFLPPSSITGLILDFSASSTLSGSIALTNFRATLT